MGRGADPWRRRESADDGQDHEPLAIELIDEESLDEAARDEAVTGGRTNAVSGSETVGLGGRNRVTELYQRAAERIARLPLASRVVGIAAVLLALSAALWLKAANAPEPPPPLRLRLQAVSFTPIREGNGLSVSILLHNDAATSAVLYRSTIAIDGLQAGQTRDWPLGAVSAGTAFAYGFALPFDCGTSSPHLKVTPRLDANHLAVEAAGSDGVHRQVQLPLTIDPWKDFAKARNDYCAGATARDVLITYEGDRAPADTTDHTFRIVLSVQNSGTDPLPISGVNSEAQALDLQPENVPTTVAAGTTGVLFVTVLVDDCAQAEQATATPYATVYLSTMREGPRFVAVPLPADAIEAQIHEACAG